MTKLRNVLILQETLNFFEGYRTSSEETYESYMNKIKECTVFLPEDIELMKKNPEHRECESAGNCKITCVDNDTFSEARGLIVRTSLFGEAIDTFNYGGKDIHKLFDNIIFAIPYDGNRPENYMEFKKRFGKVQNGAI